MDPGRGQGHPPESIAFRHRMGVLDTTVGCRPLPQGAGAPCEPASQATQTPCQEASLLLPTKGFSCFFSHLPPTESCWQEPFSLETHSVVNHVPTSFSPWFVLSLPCSSLRSLLLAAFWEAYVSSSHTCPT